MPVIEIAWKSAIIILGLLFLSYVWPSPPKEESWYEKAAGIVRSQGKRCVRVTFAKYTPYLDSQDRFMAYITCDHRDTYLITDRHDVMTATLMHRREGT